MIKVLRMYQWDLILGIEKNFSLKQLFINLFEPRKKKGKKADFWALERS